MHPIRKRDGFAFKGAAVLHAIDWRGEVQRDRRGQVREAPPCHGLEHRRGRCPLGLRHRVEEHRTPNTVVDGWYTAILDVAAQVPGAPSLAITYVSAGTGAAATVPASTAALGAEVWRDTWTDVQRDSPLLTAHYFYVPEAAANAYLHEWGAWAGPASATPGSGLLVARWLLDFDKDANIQTLLAEVASLRAEMQVKDATAQSLLARVAELETKPVVELEGKPEA